MPGIASLGTVSYNGFTFPVASDVQVTRRPVYQASGMDILYGEWTFTVSCVISSTDLGLANGTALENSFADVRRALNVPGRTFTYSGQGLGHFVNQQGVNNQGLVVTAAEDMKYGPKPNLERFKNIGQGRAVEIVWSVTVAIVDCTSSQTKDPGELSFSLSWSWDDKGQGMTTRTVAGTMSVHSHRQQDGKKLTANPDGAFDEFVKSVKRIDGFHRSVNKSYSADRTTINFTITDTEIPSDNAYSPGIVTCDASHNVTNSPQMTIIASLWVNTISGNYTVAPGVPRSFAWAAFTKLVLQRLGIAGGGGGKVDGNNDNNAIPTGSPGDGDSTSTPSSTSSKIIMVTSFSITEEVYGRSVSFSISYLQSTELSNILAKSGIWTPLGTSWKDWTESIDKIIDYDGYANLKYKDTEDVIITFCQPDNPYQHSDTPNSQTGSTSYSALRGAGYIYYQNFVRFIRETNTVMHQPTGDGDADQQTSFTNGGARVPTSGSGGNTVQDRGASALYVEIWGHAARVGDKPIVPSVKSVDGKSAVLDEEDVDLIEGPADANGTPVYAVRWRKRYFVPSQKTGKVEISNLPIPK